MTHGKKILTEKIILSYNMKYCVKPLKVKSNDIIGLWMKKKYSEENIVSIQWHPAIVDFGCASSSSQSKKECDTLIRGRQAYCLFSLCYIVQFC